MDDAGAMTEVQRLAGVGDDLDCPPRRQRAFVVHDVAQGDAVDVLHHDVRQWAAGRFGLSGVVHRDDGGVIQRGGILRLAAETQIKAGVAGQISAQHLDRNVAVQADVAG